MDYLAAVGSFLRRKRTWGDLLPWKDMLDVPEGILSTKTDGLLCAYRLWPRDVVTLSAAERGSIMLRVNDAFKRLPAGWGVWVDAVRVPFTDYPAADWPHPLAAVIDDEYRDHLLGQGTLWATGIYLSLWHRRPQDTATLARTLAFQEPHRQRLRGAHAGMLVFREGVARFMDIVALACDKVQRPDGHQLATYLKSLASTIPQPVVLPDLPINLSYKLTDHGFWPGPPATYGPDRARDYLLACTLKYRIPKTIDAALFRQLYALPFPYRWTTRWLPMDRAKARKRTEDTQINIWSTKKGGKAQLFEARRKTVELKNTYVELQAHDADAAQAQMLSDEAAHGFLTTVFSVHHPDYAVAQDWMNQITSVIRRAGCVVNDEHLNVTQSYLSSIPGSVHTNVRRLEMNTLNATHLGPWHLPWAGVPWNDRLAGPAVCLAKTDECMPYYLNTHVGDLGHTVTIGPFGSGKSTWNAFIDIVQWQRYPEAQVFGFDVGGSWRAVTLCLNGRYIDLNTGDAQIQALHGLDDPDEYPVIYEWLIDRLEEAHTVVTPDVAARVESVLDLLRRSSRPRTMTDLVAVVRESKRRVEPLARAKPSKEHSEALHTLATLDQVFSKFARGGVYGHLTDAPVDRFSVGRFSMCELASLLKLDDAWPAVMSIVFHRLEARLTGVPTRLPFGEAWVLFAVPVMFQRLKKWIPSWRRQNASGNFSTQSLTQLIDNPLTSLLYDSCQVRWFLPNASALDSESRRAYEGMRLNEEELRLLTTARPKRDGYVVRPEGRRLIDLQLPPITLAVCGANSQEAHALMDRLLAAHGPDDFAYHWLTAHGFPEAARRVQRALDREQVAEATTAMSGVHA